MYAKPKGIHIILILIVWSANIMTIDEAIDYCEKVAERNEKLCETNSDFNFCQPKWKQNADDYRQIAEYLKELKKYRFVDSLRIW